MAVTGAHGVDQYTHGHASLYGPGERVDELVGDVTTVEDIGRQRDAARRAADRREHGWIGFVAVYERVHRIAGHKRCSGDGAHQRGKRPGSGWNAVR